MTVNSELSSASVERKSCSYKNQSACFTFQRKRKFDLQYYQLYACRLTAMRERLVASAKGKWGEQIDLRELSDITEGEECVVIAILFRKMELQPSILRDIATEAVAIMSQACCFVLRLLFWQELNKTHSIFASSRENVLPLPPSDKYATPDDAVYLEAHQQRIMLSGAGCPDDSVTGSIVAVKGHEDENGKFFVSDHTYSGLPALPKPQIDECLAKGEDRYVVFVSGFGIGSATNDLFSLQMLVDLITGKLGAGQEQGMFSKVERVIIAGNCLSKQTQDKESEKKAKYLQKHIQAKSVDAVKQLDDILVQLGSSVPVDVMPGEFDPANQFLPQQPLHKCMLPRACVHSGVQSVTNPYQADVAGLRVLGTSGQNVDNIFQYSQEDDRMKILEDTLTRSHIFPTCPDTLSCYPYSKNDPFIINECPQIYFAGNQPQFSSKTITSDGGRSILLLNIPTFETTSTAVLVNLRDLSCLPVSLNSTFDE